MATIVVHGTMTLLSAKHARWWWDSWYERGFLDSVRQGMQAYAGRDDLWTVRGQPVSKIEALQMNMRTGRSRRRTMVPRHTR